MDEIRTKKVPVAIKTCSVPIIRIKQQYSSQNIRANVLFLKSVQPETGVATLSQLDRYLIDRNLVQIDFFNNVGPWSWKTKYFVNDTNGLKTSRKILIVYISDILSSISYVKRKLSATRTTKMAKYIIYLFIQLNY